MLANLKILIFLGCFVSISSQAINYRNGSLSYLNGDSFKVEPEKQQTLTFEYVVADDNWDMFMFIDVKSYSPGGSSYYGEVSPRFKLMSFSENSLLKKLSLATTFERGKNGVEANLIGAGFDFNASGFRYLKSNVYLRDNPDRSGKAYQMTTVWAMATSIAGAPILFDGYIDWVFINNEGHKNLHFNPQIKFDMKKWLGGNHQWYIGIEYDYWDHKYGIKNSSTNNTEQNTFSLLAKWHF